MDPLANKYPSLTPYNYVGNNPLLFIDPDGRQRIPTGKSVVNGLKRQASAFFKQNVETPIEKTNEAIQQGVQDGTAAYAPVADEVSTQLVVGTAVAVAVQPELVEFAPATLSAAAVAKGTALTAKGAHIAAGGNKFKAMDIVSDIINIGLPAALNVGGIGNIIANIFGEMIDAMIDHDETNNSNDQNNNNDDENQVDKKDKENDG